MKTRTKLFAFAISIIAASGIVSCTSDLTAEQDALFKLAQNDNAFNNSRMNSDVKLYSTVTRVGSTSSGAKAKSLMRKAVNVNSNMWDTLPEYPTDAEKQAVLAYVQTNPKDVQWPGWTSYFVQHLTGGHHTYSYNDRNGALHSMDGTDRMELFTIHEDSTKMSEWELYSVLQGWTSTWTTVNNFNHGECNNSASHNCELMTAGFLGARAHCEYSSNSPIPNWKLFYFEGNFYIGLDFEMHKDDGDIAPDGCYDDWIIKVIPGKGEIDPSKPVESTPTVDPTDPSTDPTEPTTPTETTEPVVAPKDTLTAHVEFDVHQQEHKDWNEIKTSIHIRDTVNTRIFLPIPQEYQIPADDFAIRIGDQYEYITKTITYCDRTYKLNLTIDHQPEGIEIVFDTDSCTQATEINGTDTTWVKIPFCEVLKAARATYYDGITFDVHCYVYPDVEPATIWEWLKTTECLQTTKTGKPKSGDCVTHTFGQTTSAYYTDENVKYVKDPE